MSKKSNVEVKIGSPLESIAAVLIFLAIIGVWVYPSDNTFDDIDSDDSVSNSIYKGPYEVVKVVDGDTIKLLIDGETTTVRLIGIDTPESVHPDKAKNVREGTLASDHTKELAQDKFVYIEYGKEPYDRYNRVLAYVYIDEDTMLNAQILKDGYAEVDTIKPNNKYEEYFLELEDEARQSNAGLWSTGVFDE